MRIAAVLLTILSLAACGSSSHGSSTSTTPPSATPATPRTVTQVTVVKTVTATPQSASAMSKPPTTASPPPLCTSSALALSYLGGLGATGHGELGFALRNTGRRSCRTYGYPGVLFLDRAGRALPTVPTHTTHDFFGTAPAEVIVLSAGASASFRLGVTHGAASPVGCTTAYGLQVIPPDNTVPLRTTIAHGAYECRTATVSPLRPGHSAFR